MTPLQPLEAVLLDMECLVIEDSAVGVAAGLASGAAVLGVPSLQPLEPTVGLVLRPSLVGLTVADLAALDTGVDAA